MDELAGSDQLEGWAKKLSVEEAIRIPHDDMILGKVKPGIPSAPEQTVSLGRVHTYVYTQELSKEAGSQRIVFPTFASHWAILVTDNGFESEYPRVYHLTFKDPSAADVKPGPEARREIQFMTNTLPEVPENAKVVGVTRFGHAQLMKIGTKMIEAFGSYHRVFWNCQDFARLYLHMITDGKARFEEWTLGQTTNLFLCAFLISVPVAKTNKVIEIQRAKQVLRVFEQEDRAKDENEVLKASDEAISLAQRLAIINYQRDRPSEFKVERVGTIRNMLDGLIKLGERMIGIKG